MMDVTRIAARVREVAEELLSMDSEGFHPLRVLAVGCSTSEIAGERIGANGRVELGEAVASALLECAREYRVDVAFQCCEHLNRALAVERDVAERFGLDIVCAVPHPRAGGSCAAAGYRLLARPALVESIRADAGIDIGQTLIGMHLRPVAVPIRLRIARIGEAAVTASRSRPKLIGGARAQYIL